MSGVSSDQTARIIEESEVAQRPWQLLQAGYDAEAIRRLREAYERDVTSASHIMTLGVAYLWVQDYLAAWKHFDSANQRRPKHAPFFGMAGAARWCLDDPEASVREWRAGLKSGYADGAGGVDLPLLLFFASVVKPELFDHREAENLLANRMENPLIHNWPGPLAEFVSGRIDVETLRRRCIGVDDDSTFICMWRADFYIGVLQRVSGNAEHFQDMMRKTATTSPDDFDLAKRRRYLRKLWHPEFFIARHRAGLTASGAEHCSDEH
jgi:hypothetical protein